MGYAFLALFFVVSLILVAYLAISLYVWAKEQIAKVNELNWNERKRLEQLEALYAKEGKTS